MEFLRFEDYLPQRDTALMFDDDSRILGVGKKYYSHTLLPGELGETIVIKTRIKEDDFRFNGHFPERKIYPGHWQLEMMCQAAIILVKCLEPETKGLPALALVESFRLVRPIMVRGKPADIIVKATLLKIVEDSSTSHSLMYIFRGILEYEDGRAISGASFVGMKHTFKEK